jgi:hypothetical protein
MFFKGDLDDYDFCIQKNIPYSKLLEKIKSSSNKIKDVNK